MTMYFNHDNAGKLKDALKSMICSDVSEEELMSLHVHTGIDAMLTRMAVPSTSKIPTDLAHHVFVIALILRPT